MNKILRNLFVMMTGLLVAFSISAQCTLTLSSLGDERVGFDSGEVDIFVNGDLRLTWGGIVEIGQGMVLGTMPGDLVEFYYRSDDPRAHNQMFVSDCNGNEIFNGDLSQFTGQNTPFTQHLMPDSEGNCPYSITMVDADIDPQGGWDGFTLDVYIDGTYSHTLTLESGHSGFEIILVPDGSTVTISVATLGNFPTEVGFAITNPRGVTDYQTVPSDWKVDSPLGIIYSGTASCRLAGPCTLDCAFTGSGAFDQVFNLSAGQCCVDISIPVSVNGDCYLFGDEANGLDDILCSLALKWDVANCSDTQSGVDESASTITLVDQYADAGIVSEYDGCGAGQSEIEWMNSVDGQFCFEYSVTGSTANFTFENQVSGIMETFSPGSGTVCYDLLAGTASQFSVVGNGSGDSATYSNLTFKPYVQLAAGPFNYLTEVCIGDTSVDLVLTGPSSSFECNVPVTVNAFSGTATNSLFCNDAINVSVDETCCVTFDADMFLEGGPYYCYDDYIVRIKPFGGNDYLDIDPTSGVNFDVNGETLCELPLGEHIYEVVDANTGNLCWGHFTLEDKFPPRLECDCAAVGELVNLNGFTGDLSEEDETAGWLFCGGNHGILSNVTPYDAIPFSVECDGTWTIRVEGAVDMSYFIYDASNFPGYPTCDWDSFGALGSAATATLESGTDYYIVITSTIAKEFGEYQINVFNSGFNKCEPTTFNTGIASHCRYLCLDETNWGVIDNLPGPSIVDNCGQGELSYTDIWKDGACGDRILTRTWQLDAMVSHSSYQSVCVQEFLFERLDFDDIMMPAELTELDCGGDYSPATLLARYRAAESAAVANFYAGFNSLLAGNPSKATVEAYVAANWPNLSGMAMAAGFGPFYKELIPLEGYPNCYVESVVPVDINICNLYPSYEDVEIPACGEDCPGNVKVIRTWTILDWCDSSFITYAQIIKATDNESPAIQVQSVYTASVDPWTCKANFALPCPTLLNDDCSNIVDYHVIGPQGVIIEEAPGFSCGDWAAYTAFDLPKNDMGPVTSSGSGMIPHLFQYVATDCCGNETIRELHVFVVDETPPVAQTVQNTVISLTSSPGENNGTAKIFWESIDQNSYDKCSDVYVEIRRDDGAPACGNLGVGGYNNNVTFNNDEDDDCDFCTSCNNCGPIPDDVEHYLDHHGDTDDGQFVKFCCEDLTEVDSMTGVMYGMVKVWIRVWDDGNMTNNFGDWVDINGDGDFSDPGEQDNYSDLWAYVRVEDKLAPQIVCPADVTLKCDELYDDFLVTGTAFSSGTCNDLTVTHTDAVNLDPCGAGVVKRTWCIDGTSYCCTQTITLEYQSSWNECSFGTGIIWPNDFTGERLPQYNSCSYNDAANAPSVFGTGNQRPRAALDCRDTDTGGPDYSRYRGCDLIGHSLDSDTFQFEDGACYKVLNYWKVINWCLYNPGDADWDEPTGEFLDNDNDGIPNLEDWDDDGDGKEDSYYTSGNNRRYYFDDHGSLYWVTFNPNNGNYQNNGRNYNIDVWDLALVATDGNYFGTFDPNNEDDGIADGLYEHTQVIKFVDTEAPNITTEEEPCYAVSSDIQTGPCTNNPTQLDCEAFVTLTASADDSDSDCPSNWLKWHVQIDMLSDWSIDYEYSSYIEGYTVNGSGVVVPVNCPFYLDPTSPGEDVQIRIPDPISGSKYKHRVIWKVEDGCNNVTSYETWFTVEDKKAPTPYCVNLSTALMDNGLVELWACDFDQGAFDNCSTDLKFTFDGPDEGYDAPEDTNYWDDSTGCQGRWFTCNDLAASTDGFLPVKVYVWDECNNVDFCMVNLRLVDNQGACEEEGEGFSRVISGHVFTEDGRMLEDVEVEKEITGLESSDLNMTDVEGEYMFPTNQQGLDYRIDPTKNVDFLNGVTTLDLVLIQKHILGVELLGSPYQMIAADANNDERITAIDLLSIRKLILAIDEEYANNTSWRFADANTTLDLDNPWSVNESIAINNLALDMMDLDFIGIKIGDINNSVSVSSLDEDIEQRSAGSIDLEFNSTYENGKVIYEVRSNNFNDIYGFQFTLNAGGQEFVSVESGSIEMTNNNFGVIGDRVTVSWNNKEAITSSEVLFTLTFEASDVQNSNVSISSAITKAEAYQGNQLDIIDVKTATTGALEFALNQNEPNPFKNNTSIGFVLPEDGQATLTVYDVTGKVISLVKGNYIQGYNEIELSEKDMNTSGVLYYQLESGDYTATKKMIILD